MGKKKRTFADKIAKGTGPRGDVCPKCEEVIRPIKVIRAYKSDVSDSWRYEKNMVKVCKCNEKEVLS